MILGVADGWSDRKGLDIFAKLVERAPEHWHIVLVGTNEQIDQILLENIISVHRTHDVMELVSIYSATDVFFNPTREEVLGMVNIEALACGVPVVTFNTGGCPECTNNQVGYIVESEDIDLIVSYIEKVCEKKSSLQRECMAWADSFKKETKYEEYINLYGQR